MSDVRSILARGVGGAAPPPDGFERMLRRRDHKHRNQRLVAGLVAAIVVAAFLVGSIAGYVRSEQPANPRPGTPFRLNGEVLRHCCDGVLEAVDPTTGVARVLIKLPVSNAAWSPDRSRLAYAVECDWRSPSDCERRVSRNAGIWIRGALGHPVRLVSWYRAGGASGNFA
jgi:hypothetical protein